MHKTVLITGASRGIGRETALCFARHGASLVINCRNNVQLLMELCDEIRSLGCDCIAVPGDVGEPSFAQSFAEAAVRRFAGIDVLVNNAGISKVGLFTDTTDKDWHDVISTNLDSVFYCSRAVLPEMLRRKQGSIINVSSVWGSVGASCEVAYSASKGGVNAFTRALAKEMAPSRIAVNAIACGAIDTDMNRCFSEDELKSLADEIPAGRMGTAAEAAELIYSISESSPYLTGQVITLDGGWM